jgi:hypothetical protein
MPYGTKHTYTGAQLKSSHELAWAQFFDAEGLRWSYEPVKFRDPGAPEGKGYSYTPDFGLEENSVFIEIKAAHVLHENRFHFCTKPLLIAIGKPLQRPHFYVQQRGGGLQPLHGIPWSVAYHIVRRGLPSWMGERSCFNIS